MDDVTGIGPRMRCDDIGRIAVAGPIGMPETGRAAYGTRRAARLLGSDGTGWPLDGAREDDWSMPEGWWASLDCGLSPAEGAVWDLEM
jgi:hypothetical protein